MAVMAPLLSPLVGGCCTGSDSLSVNSCVVMSGCAVPTDPCLVVTVVWTLSDRHSTSACSFCVVILACTVPQDGSLVDTIVDTVGRG